MGFCLTCLTGLHEETKRVEPMMWTKIGMTLKGRESGFQSFAIFSCYLETSTLSHELVVGWSGIPSGLKVEKGVVPKASKFASFSISISTNLIPCISDDFAFASLFLKFSSLYHL